MVATANQARQAVGLWECEASALGLCENQRKRKFVVKSTRQRQALRALELEPAEEAEILGTTFGIQESEIVNTKRTQVFAQTLQRLCTLPVSPQQREKLYRTVLLPQFSWGNWWTVGTDKQYIKLTSRVKRALRILTDGARALWLSLGGHWLDVQFTTQLHYVAAFFRAEIYWGGLGYQCVQGQWGHAVCKFLSAWGFVQTGFCSWEHPSGDQLQMDTEAGLGRRLHAVRERWRRHQHMAFVQHDRHEAIEIRQLQHDGYSEQRVKKAMVLFNDLRWQE